MKQAICLRILYILFALYIWCLFANKLIGSNQTLQLASMLWCYSDMISENQVQVPSCNALNVLLLLLKVEWRESSCSQTWPIFCDTLAYQVTRKLNTVCVHRVSIFKPRACLVHFQTDNFCEECLRNNIILGNTGAAGGVRVCCYPIIPKAILVCDLSNFNHRKKV